MDVETSYSEFINCDRTGRRNAVPDIKGEAVAEGTGELTKDMAQMDLKAAGTSHSFTSSRKAATVLIFLQHSLLLIQSSAPPPLPLLLILIVSSFSFYCYFSF